MENIKPIAISSSMAKMKDLDARNIVDLTLFQHVDDFKALHKSFKLRHLYYEIVLCVQMIKSAIRVIKRS